MFDTLLTEIRTWFELAYDMFLALFELAYDMFWIAYWRADNFIAENKEVSLLAVLLVVTVLLAHTLFTTASSKATTVTTVLCHDRRSVEQFSGPAPLAGIMTALTCAIHAPNHFLTEPWRFRLLGKQAKVTLGACADKFTSTGAFGAVPDFIVVSLAATAKNKGFHTWTVQGLEDHAACACAIQNFLLSCASQGIATKWMTGKMGVSGPDMLHKVCGVDANTDEHYMGTILVGMPATPLASLPVPVRKTGLSEPVFAHTQ